MHQKPRVAFVHEWLTSYTGAEKVLEAAAEQFPEAPIYTLVYQKQNFETSPLRTHKIITSWIERLPKGREKYRSYLMFMPLAIEQFNLENFDIILSSSHAVAKGVITRHDQLHISYIHTPIRYAWDLQYDYLREAGLDRGLRGIFAKMILHYIRLWDLASSSRVDVMVANSNYVARRIWKTYQRKAQVIYPPVDVDRFDPTCEREPFYLTISRFVPYKRIDLIVEAFNRLQLPLIVIGSGPDWKKVQSLAECNIQLLGQQPDDIVTSYLQRCKAFVFAADEDFGIAPVEAQAAGAPVIAYGRGGVIETVLPGTTGIFFNEQNADALVQAVEKMEKGDYFFDPISIRKNAERFSKERFQKEFMALVEREWSEFQKLG